MKLLIGKVGILILFIVIFFLAFINGYLLRVTPFVMFGTILLLPISKFSKRVNITIKKRWFDVIVLIAFVVLSLTFIFHNSAHETGNMGTVISFGCFTFLIFSLSNSENWTHFFCKWLIRFSVFFPLITILFFVLPDLCSSVMKPIWLDLRGTPYAPGSHSGGLYKVGFTTHYSNNGIYCAIACICCYTKVLFSNKKIWKVLMVISFVGLLLTTKRAHLLFTVFSVFVTYYFIKPDNKVGRVIKISILLFAAFFLIIFISGFVPELSETFARFNVNNGGDISSHRFELWSLAINGFKSSPLIGIGWYGYIALYNKYLLIGEANQYAHNVYIEMLCENGIIGLICYITIVLYLFIKTVNLIKVTNNLNQDFHYYLALSLCIQVFFLSYSLTGNCLYDFTYYFYAFAIALMFYVSKKIKESELIKI